MKLFQQLLVAPAAIGLMAPLAANAADLNLGGVSEYSSSSEVQNFSDIQPSDWAFKALSELIESKGCKTAVPSSSITRYEAAALFNSCFENVAELNVQGRRLLDELSPELAQIKASANGIGQTISEVEAGGFASTTSIAGQAVFTTGNVNDGATDTEEALVLQYGYTLEVTSSFYGDDLLYAEIETGNADGGLVNLDSAIEGDDSLNVASFFYEFPLGGLDVLVGPLVDQDDVIAATTSLYSDAYRIGSLGFSAGGNETGPGAAVAYDGDNGWVASFSFVADDGNFSWGGIGGDEADDVTTLSIGYNGDGYGGGVVVANNDGDFSGGLFEYNTFGAGLYYTPESIPASVSITYDTGEAENVDIEVKELFIGIEYETGPGTLGAAYVSTEYEDSDEGDETGFELNYTYPLYDGVTITPGVFKIEDNRSGDDETGVFVETVFTF